MRAPINRTGGRRWTPSLIGEGWAFGSVSDRASRGLASSDADGLGCPCWVASLRLVANVPVVRAHPDLDLPAHARPGDAGVDLRASEDVTLEPAGGRALVPTGLSIAIPDGFAGFIQPRSGLAFKHGVTVLNSPGLIDSGYRGELKVLLINTDPTEPFEVRRGERIAQLVLQAYESVTFVEVDELPSSERGDGGFGSTGT